MKWGCLQMDIERIPIDQYVRDSCNEAVTDADYRVIQPYALMYDHGLYCPCCDERLTRYVEEAGEEKPVPKRIYVSGQAITYLSREMWIGSIEQFDPERHR